MVSVPFQNEARIDGGADFRIGEQRAAVRDLRGLRSVEHATIIVEQIDRQQVVVPCRLAAHGLGCFGNTEVTVQLRAHREMIADRGGALFHIGKYDAAKLIIIDDGLKAREHDQQGKHFQREVARRRPDERVQEIMVDTGAPVVAHGFADSPGRVSGPYVKGRSGLFPPFADAAAFIAERSLRGA